MNRHILIFQSVSYSFNNKSNFKFSDLNLSIPENSITSIIGRNGSGKTTLLLLLLGFLTPSSGGIYLTKNGASRAVQEIKGKIALLPQNEIIPKNYSVDDFLLLGRLPYVGAYSQPTEKDTTIVSAIKDTLRINNIASKTLNQISGGELQRVRIGRALVQEADIILFDEPITHLDIESKYEVMRIIKDLKQSGKTILFSTHDPLEAFYIADYSILINIDHTIEMGVSSKILTDEKLSNCLGLPLETGTFNGKPVIVSRKGFQNGSTKD